MDFSPETPSNVIQYPPTGIEVKSTIILINQIHNQFSDGLFFFGTAFGNQQC